MLRGTKRGTVIGAAVGVVALAGTAFATVFATTTVNGNLSVADTQKQVADDVYAGVDATTGGAACSVNDHNGETLTINLTASTTTLVGEDGSEKTTGLAGDSCTFNVEVRNVGEVPLEVVPGSIQQLRNDANAVGWDLQLDSEVDSDSIAPVGDSENATYKLVATSNAQDGVSINGTIKTQPYLP